MYLKGGTNLLHLHDTMLLLLVAPQIFSVGSLILALVAEKFHLKIKNRK